MILKWGASSVGAVEGGTAAEILDIIALGTVAVNKVAHWYVVSLVCVPTSAGVIFETFSWSDAGGRFSKGDTRAEFGLCVFF